MSISSTGAGSVFTHSARQHFKPPSFDTLDSNSDGGITLEELISGAPKGASGAEASKRAEHLFKAMDSDGSGDVSSAEKDAFDAKMADQRQSMQFATQQLSSQTKADIFAATDTDGSGGVSLSEFSAEASGTSPDALQSLFGMIDQNGDGSITATESSDFFDAITTALNQSGPDGGGRPAGGPPPGGPPPGGPPPGADGTGSTSLSALAANAYKSTQSSSDLLSTLRGLLSETA